MFVFLKILLLLFRPLIWIVLFFILGFFLKHPKRKSFFLKAGFIGLLFFSNPFIIRFISGWYEPASVKLGANEQFNAGIVLGGFVSYDPEDQRGYFNPAADRFIETALLYKTGHIKKVIVAAGNGYMVPNGFREADFVKEQLINLGIPASDIFTDANSRNTEENATNAKAIIDSAHIAPPWLLISSAMHLPRASEIFRNKGIDAKIYPCDFTTKNSGNNILEDYILPSPSAFRQWDFLIKEIVGRIAYKISGKT
jgi:uncharacterized SAM-binding protein YcdF (DUF218 family)